PCGASGNYNLSIPYAYLNGTELTRFAPAAYASTVCTNGQTVVAVAFSPQYFLTLQSTEGGLAEITLGQGISSLSLWVDNQSSGELGVVVDPGYIFLGWNGTGVGSYTGPAANTGVVLGAPISEVAAFGVPIKAPIPRYWLNLTAATALAPGTSWAVTVGGIPYSSATRSINVTSLLSGTYPLTVLGAASPDGLTRYSPLSAPATLSVTKNSTVQLTFAVAFWVSLSADEGGTISAPAAGSGWYESGAPLALSAAPNPGFVFLGWVGTGNGSYSGASLNGSVTVKNPVGEVASFGLAPPAAKTVSASSAWSSPATWLGLAALGLVIGALLGLWVGRRRAGRPGSRAPPLTPSDAELPNGGESIDTDVSEETL
ncbi:MAG: hypothetical protein L3K17_09410, partial [Thermoplasmata archaeon]|nr:hypothetical protein [Thermoplasmata archaeon]